MYDDRQALRQPPPDAPSPREAAALAERYGLEQTGVRPPLLAYVRETWRCRSFIWTMASARSSAKHGNTYLGHVWALLNPLMLAAAYFVVFGLLLGTRKGVDNFIGFLTAGIFLFQFISVSLNKGANAVVNNRGLVRALQFPRCVLPLSVALTEFLAALPAFGLLVVIMLVTGERPGWMWLLYPVGIGLNLLVNTGLVLIVARVVSVAPDLGNLTNIAVRLLRYTSGVFFSIEAYTQGHGALGLAMGYQPFALNLSVVRESLMNEFSPVLLNWLVAAAWGVLMLVGGFVIFWRGEESYGRG
ncbi:MAG TPA: ABC transporter permease [Segeticoccus sp.]|nr:ABC transporter permease [Segeticoccus sp.]